MAKISILSGAPNVVEEIMNTTYLVDLEFISIEVYSEAIKNGFDAEKFLKKNPEGIKILINNQEIMKN